MVLHAILSKISKFTITRRNDAFVARIVNARLTKNFIANFALATRLPTSATLWSSDQIFYYHRNGRKWCSYFGRLEEPDCWYFQSVITGKGL